jgi:hypothetical protein
MGDKSVQEVESGLDVDLEEERGVMYNSTAQVDESDSDSSNDEALDHNTVGEGEKNDAKSSRGVDMSFEQLKIAVELLCGKHRSEYPTTMNKAKKKAQVATDIATLASSAGPTFNDRQYIAFAKKVEKTAAIFRATPDTTLNLKDAFGFPKKKLVEARLDQVQAMLDRWGHVQPRRLFARLELEL